MTISNADNLRIDACVYILHGLLQRLERQQPGLLAEMIEGMTNDQAAMAETPPGSPDASRGRDIAGEAIRMLRLANDQLHMTVVPPAKS
ncbi:hypothetical protein QTI66_11685 [Variovorax sp. J22R133]|uniref:hypothetical protein n=1 Tax=Variovorax brevis TaxID=3053503 RepID=UPI002577333D|nr:hypothetical protein [Variovorax sp. J22R133]MDM0112811.1 hypothetical protein [Variovorax sp. J22R133]